MNTLFSKTILCATLLFWLTACNKSREVMPSTEQPSSFDHYQIRQGQHYCDRNVFINVTYQELKFIVKFDNTAIYTTVNPDNQYDINKLYGFSDNDSYHQEFSARIGWRWSDGALRLFGYVYNNGIVTSKELATISIGTEHNCSIKINGDSYIFSVDDKTTAMPRTSKGTAAKGYRLYPYFGGDETAPHDINIWIKEK
jgi:hypothetical protein